MKASRLVLVLVLVVSAFGGVAGEKSSETSNDKVVPVESNFVCMINNRSMANEQIPVPVDGKTYYGCCPMCKERLAKDEAARYAIDPVSGKKSTRRRRSSGRCPARRCCTSRARRTSSGTTPAFAPSADAGIRFR